MKDNNKITSKLFRKEIRDKDFIKDFERVFEIKIEDLLSEYDDDEIDELPFEIESRGILIGFMAEDSESPLQMEYVDFDICNYPQNISYLEKSIPLKFDFSNHEEIEKYLNPCSNLRTYYSLHNLEQLERIIFQHGDLRYELSMTSNITVFRIRVCFNENESNMNMRTYYSFSE